MHLRPARHLTAAAIAPLAVAGILVGTTGLFHGPPGLSLDISAACGCELEEKGVEEKGGIEGETPEEEKVAGLSITSVAWNEGGNCHKSLLGKVKFTAIGQWCEYEVKNTNGAEKLLIVPGQKYKPPCEFRGGVELCLEFIQVAVGHTECGRGTVLPPGVGKECYVRIKYVKKPQPVGAESEMGFYVKGEFIESKVNVKREARELLK